MIDDVVRLLRAFALLPMIIMSGFLLAFCMTKPSSNRGKGLSTKTARKPSQTCVAVKIEPTKDEHTVIKLGSGEKEKDKEKESSGDVSKTQPSSLNAKLKTDNRSIWAHRIAQRKCSQISQEHKDKIKGYVAPNQTYNACEANAILNRYTDVLCNDATRVVLKNRPNDYIHASWIITPDKSSTYICAQGPLPETISDFWAMIYQEKTKIVLMLCSSSEGGGEKCATYYPDKKTGKEKYGNMLVEFVVEKEEPIENVTWTVFNVSNADDKKSAPFEVYHVLVPWWPDQLAPSDAKPMVKLYKWVKEINTKNSPVVVHCSAGVGRTATFVGIDYANIRIKHDANIELIDVVKEMRALRYQSIQSHMQFLFLHVCLLEYFIEEGFVERDESINKFIEQYRSHALKKLAKRKEEQESNETRYKKKEAFLPMISGNRDARDPIFAALIAIISCSSPLETSVVAGEPVRLQILKDSEGIKKLVDETKRDFYHFCTKNVTNNCGYWVDYKGDKIADANNDVKVEKIGGDYVATISNSRSKDSGFYTYFPVSEDTYPWVHVYINEPPPRPPTLVA
ncbi:unnamed protein product [Caenorhabditis bovis]|uniref:Protein-tyrosine-phosphatase n=1 Tax=Caenorhabditis bovis TaxID=2654633 RepID=A0A8S1EXR3_9PELO|nr:unnamed protein product [Caenorhabditis bovis]